MPTTITAQNGAVIQQSTKIAVQGCTAVKASKTKKPTNAQKLAKALAACRRRFKHTNTKRLACEKQARKRPRRAGAGR
jgi:transposase